MCTCFDAKLNLLKMVNCARNSIDWSIQRIAIQLIAAIFGNSKAYAYAAVICSSCFINLPKLFNLNFKLNFYINGLRGV